MTKRYRQKNLGLPEWVQIFQRTAREGGRVLPFESLRRVSGLTIPSLRQALHRLQAKGFVYRVGPSLYASSLHPPSLEEIAMVVGRPAYLSLETALARYGVLSQIPSLLTAVTTGKPRRLRTALGEISFRHIGKKLFFGYRDEGGIFWAEPEKALLDWFYLKSIRPRRAFSPDEMNLENIGRQKLLRLAHAYPETVQRQVQAFLS